jgi:hypothetical protein
MKSCKIAILESFQGLKTLARYLFYFKPLKDISGIKIDYFDLSNHNFDKLEKISYFNSIKDELISISIKLSNINSIKFEEYDYVIIAELDFLRLLSFRKRIEKCTFNKFIILDVSDSVLVDRIFFNKNILVYFKREYLKFKIKPLSLEKIFSSYLPYDSLLGNLKSRLLTFQAYNYDKLVPLPFTFFNIPNFTPSKTKKYTVFFADSLYLSSFKGIFPGPGFFIAKAIRLRNYKERLQISDFMKQIKNSYLSISSMILPKMSYFDYLTKLSESLCSISHFGASFDTFRFWETMYAGTALITKKPMTVIPKEPVEGKHCFYFNNLKEMKNIVYYLIEDENEAIKMGLRAREFVLKYHSPEARTKYILEKIKELTP